MPVLPVPPERHGRLTPVRPRRKIQGQGVQKGGFSGIVLAGDDVKSGLELDFSRVVVALVIENLKFTDVHLSRL